MITASCFDSREILETKYSEVHKTLSELGAAPGPPRPEGSDESSQQEWSGFSPSPPGSNVHDYGRDADSEGARGTHTVSVLYGIDATKLSSAHKKALKPRSPFTKIVFNFPHVGGLSTDVNRQVRYNQGLLVGFFKSAKPLLSSPSHPATILRSEKYDDDEEEEISDNLGHWDPGAVNGQILVTIFEGEPYSLWNIRDLARHCGLKVIESFKFPWSAYPGYRHARTIGDIISGKDRGEEGAKRKGAWRGEERDGRCYVLEDQDAFQPLTKKQRQRDEDDVD